jgi:hypothetical protein
LQAANVEVYVTQMPQQDVAMCHARNVHKRSLEDVSAASASLEAPPPAAVRLDCSCLVDLPGQPPVPTESAATGDATVSDGSAQAPKRRFSEAPGDGDDAGPLKRAKSEEPIDGFAVTDAGRALSDSALLASVDAGLRAHDERKGATEAKSRWEADEEDDAGAAPATNGKAHANDACVGAY